MARNKNFNRLCRLTKRTNAQSEIRLCIGILKRKFPKSDVYQSFDPKADTIDKDIIHVRIIDCEYTLGDDKTTKYHIYVVKSFHKDTILRKFKK